MAGVKLHFRAQEEGSSFSTHRLALTMLIKIVKSLGCAYGCGEGHRGLSGDRLRMQVGLRFSTFAFRASETAQCPLGGNEVNLVE